MSKTDKELLELAAKAAGIDASFDGEFGSGMWLRGKRNPDNSRYWSPLTDDGDALRLAAKLGMNVDMTPGKYAEASIFVENNTRRVSGICDYGPSPDAYAATRRAIVRAAAAIGESM